jgi:hypothetical protein
MAEQNVVIKIQADVSKATNNVKALQQVIAKLSASGTQAAAGTEKVGNAAKKTATASQLLDKEIKKVIAGQGSLERVTELATQALEEEEAAARRLADVSKAVEGAVGKKGAAVLGASKQVGGLADASGAASFALLSLGQAFQDSAQFGMGFAQGFRAINNNIQQTFTAIALGSIQAGGFANLLKLMGGSLWGPGGLILGFSAVTAGIEFFTTRAQRAKEEGEDFAKAWEQASSSLISFNNALEGKKFVIPEDALVGVAEDLRREVGLIAQAQKALADADGELFDSQSAIADLQATQLQGQARQLGLDKEANQIVQDRADLEMEREAAAFILAGYTEAEIAARKELLRQFDEEIALNEKLAVIKASLEARGFKMEGSTAKTRKETERLTEVERARLRLSELIAQFGGDGTEERELGQLQARIGLMESLRDSTIEYSQSIEEMRVLMNQVLTIKFNAITGEFEDMAVESDPLIEEAQRLEDVNEELRERIRLRRQIMGLEKIGADQLRGLGEATQDFTEEYKRESDARIKADAESAEAFFAMQQGISKGIGLVSQSFGSMGTTFMQLAQQQEGGSRRMFKIGKALAISQAVMNSYVAYTTALADKTIPGPMRFVAAGAALAAGLAQVAAIKSAEFGQGGKGRQVSAPNVFAGVTSVGALPGGAASQLASQPASQRSDLSVAALGGFGGGVQVELVAQGRNLVSVSSMEANASKRRSGLQTIGGGIIR